MTQRHPTQATLEVIRELHAQAQQPTTAAIAEVAGIKLGTATDHTRTLVEQGLIRRVARGVFAPVHVHPEPRAVTKTVLPDGCTKLEVGDTVLLLTPHEDRMLATLMGGAASQVAAIQAGHTAAMLASDMNQRLNVLERSLPQAGR